MRRRGTEPAVAPEPAHRVVRASVGAVARGRRTSNVVAGAKRRTASRIRPTPDEKACGFTARRGSSAAPLFG